VTRLMTIIRDLGIVEKLQSRDSGISPTQARRQLLDNSKELQRPAPKQYSNPTNHESGTVRPKGGESQRALISGEDSPTKGSDS
jgi:hypothetical protein